MADLRRASNCFSVPWTVFLMSRYAASMSSADWIALCANMSTMGVTVA